MYSICGQEQESSSTVSREKETDVSCKTGQLEGKIAKVERKIKDSDCIKIA